MLFLISVLLEWERVSAVLKMPFIAVGFTLRMVLRVLFFWKS